MVILARLAVSKGKSWAMLLRVKQWIKNGFVLVPLIFSLRLTETDALVKSVLVFFAFCFASSFIYIINDIKDKDADAIHPKKSNRPLASGAVSVSEAIYIDVLCLLISGVLLAFLGNAKAAIVILGYIVLNLAYSYKVKEIPIIDVFSIAFGFVLRIYAGAYAIGASVSSYMFMVMLFLSLFLALGKRKSELIKLRDIARKSLSGYISTTLDKYLTILAAAVIISYSLYTLDPHTLEKFGNRLIYSVVFVVFGILRYMAELDKRNDYDDPTENIYKDKLLLAACAMFVGYVILLGTDII
jgi:4-hydroxybenzoate polyprenyltransferase